MTKYNYLTLKDEHKSLKQIKSIINLISADVNNEQIQENLQSIVSHLELATSCLDAVLKIAEEIIAD